MSEPIVAYAGTAMVCLAAGIRIQEARFARISRPSPADELESSGMAATILYRPKQRNSGKAKKRARRSKPESQRGIILAGVNGLWRWWQQYAEIMRDRATLCPELDAPLFQARYIKAGAAEREFAHSQIASIFSSRQHSPPCVLARLKSCLATIRS